MAGCRGLRRALTWDELCTRPTPSFFGDQGRKRLARLSGSLSSTGGGRPKRSFDEGAAHGEQFRDSPRTPCRTSAGSGRLHHRESRTQRAVSSKTRQCAERGRGDRAGEQEGRGGGGSTDREASAGAPLAFSSFVGLGDLESVGERVGDPANPRRRPCRTIASFSWPATELALTPLACRKTQQACRVTQDDCTPITDASNKTDFPAAASASLSGARPLGDAVSASAGASGSASYMAA